MKKLFLLLTTCALASMAVAQKTNADKIELTGHPELDGTIHLEWSKVAGAESYRIERNVSMLHQPREFVNIQIGDKPVGTFTDSEVKPMWNYWYTLVAHMSDGTMRKSEAIEITSLQPQEARISSYQRNLRDLPDSPYIGCLVLLFILGLYGLAFNDVFAPSGPAILEPHAPPTNS